MMRRAFKYLTEIKDAAKYMLQGLSVTLSHMGRRPVTHHHQRQHPDILWETNRDKEDGSPSSVLGLSQSSDNIKEVSSQNSFECF